MSILLGLSATAAFSAPQWQFTSRRHLGAPVITAERASRAVTAGQTATFSVRATGRGVISYQWFENESAINGATSRSYTTPPATASDNGAQFTVTVADSAGSVTSTAAILTVNAASSILNVSSTSLAFGNVNVSTPSTQTVTLTNMGGSLLTISSVVVAGAGFNASGAILGLLLSIGQTANLTATFDPAEAGNATGSITVASNAANSPLVITLSGTGVAPEASHSVSLSWAASTSSVGGYNVCSSRVSGGPYAKLTPFELAATSYTDSSVQQGQTYYYVVTAVNSQNQESGYSAQVSATIP